MLYIHTAMGNSSAGSWRPQVETGPCHSCKHFVEWKWDGQRKGVRCATAMVQFFRPLDGCWRWEREPGTDDEDAPAVGAPE